MVDTELLLDLLFDGDRRRFFLGVELLVCDRSRLRLAVEILLPLLSLASFFLAFPFAVESKFFFACLGPRLLAFSFLFLLGVSAFGFLGFFGFFGLPVPLSFLADSINVFPNGSSWFPVLTPSLFSSYCCINSSILPLASSVVNDSYTANDNSAR